MNVHFRLEEERKRIKIDREQMAAAGGVALRTYANYVTGHRAPDSSFLSGIAAAGADVLYILTGRREARAEAVADVARADYAVARPGHRALTREFRPGRTIPPTTAVMAHPAPGSSR